MNAASAESHPTGLAGTSRAAPEAPPGQEPPGEGSWTRSRWLTLIALVFAAHVLLLFAFGGRKQIVPRAVTNVPTLKLADDSGEWLALNDPTLFALPHQKDFASAIWLAVPTNEPPSFRWTEPPRWLPLSVDALGMAFNQFMQTNRFASFELQLKSPVKLSAPGLPVEPALAKTSTLQIQDGLAQRRLSDAINLPSWPYADVLAPSVVQAVVDAPGNVVSTVLLSPSGYDAADQRALELARAARFAPASRLTVGRMIFNWHTVPPPATNPPAASP
jgi:TonB family protein